MSEKEKDLADTEPHIPSEATRFSLRTVLGAFGQYCIEEGVVPGSAYRVSALDNAYMKLRLLLIKRGPPSADTGSGWGLIAAERARQIETEGYTSEHDDKHAENELSEAAACYARRASERYYDELRRRTEMAPTGWPWEENWWKPKSPLEDLVRAGALIAAEIDRILRKIGGRV